MKKHASAVWKGSIKEGQGSISTETGVLSEVPYGFRSRFGDGTDTNPEELLGAAHAACFSMALSLGLTQAGLTADLIETKATVSLDKDGEGFSITAIHLACQARIPGLDQAGFDKIAQATKLACPVSKVLRASITLDATLES
jgi:osmotically inducible protein OsmC